MPKTVSDHKTNLSEKRKENSGWNSQLFPSGSVEDSISGIGFKDKAKAKETLELLEGKDVTYQYNVINTMYNRAKSILKRTKDEEKVKNLSEAVRVFEEWINHYKSKNRHLENFNYLSLDLVQSYQKLAQYYKIPENDFLKAYEEVNGDYKKLRGKVVDNSNPSTWDVQRNRTLKPLVKKIENTNDLFENKNMLSGLPTKIHTELIMWAYSPEQNKIKKCVNLIDEKIK